MKKRILITGPYLPGKSYGGPVKSLYNLVESLGDEFDFFIITNDRDLNSDIQYSGVKIGEWNKVGKANVLYSPSGDFFKHMKKTNNEENYDLVYCSSFFSEFTLITQFLKIMGKITAPILVAPRGEFSEGALNIKSLKKSMYLSFYKLLKMHEKIYFTCTSEEDKKDVQNVFGNNINIYKAGNIVNGKSEYNNKNNVKKEGDLRIATVSRISRIKNIDYSIDILKAIAEKGKPLGEIVFDIYGPVEDKVYYQECLEKVNNIGERIKVNFKGSIDYDDVVSTLSTYHIFLFPTKGENFGHVIQEALISGCPVIISDQTPWKQLKEKGVGIELSLDNINGFIEAINYYLCMDTEKYKMQSEKAYRYGLNKVENQKAIIEHKNLFNNILN